jgi:hypothetical protein
MAFTTKNRSMRIIVVLLKILNFLKGRNCSKIKANKLNVAAESAIKNIVLFGAKKRTALPENTKAI